MSLRCRLQVNISHTQRGLGHFNRQRHDVDDECCCWRELEWKKKENENYCQPIDEAIQE